MRLIPLRIRRLIYVLLTIFINFSLSEFIDYSDIGGDVGRSSTASQPIGGCSRTSDCIEQVRRIAAETGRFWFGDPWQFNCAAHNRNKINSINCINPRELSAFHSLGSRLFRANTFTQAYLSNLRVFPRIRYTPQSGSYRACDHEFSVPAPPFLPPSFEDPSASVAELGFDSAPILPFQIRQAPEFRWSGLRANDSYAVMMLDVGFGMLKYLAVNFPQSTKVIYEYEQLDNFRPRQPTPFVVLVFEAPPSGWDNLVLERFSNEKIFDLSQFMIDNELDDALIGLNWVLVDSDPFAIERQRLKGVVDNCHALIQQKMVEDRRWKFVEFFPLNEMDSSLTISFRQPKSQHQACCKYVEVNEDTLFADPLSDYQIPSMAARQHPFVTSLRPLSTADNYQRSQRHYIGLCVLKYYGYLEAEFVLKEERYTLIAFDPDRHYLHWLIVDIPSDALPTGSLRDGQLVAPYLPIVPKTPGDCLFGVFILFKQPSGGVPMTEFYNNDHVLRSTHCVGNCIYRNSFEIEQFKSFHRLQFLAISWAKVCYDIFEASHQIQSILRTNVSREVGKVRNQKPSMDTLSAVERPEELRKRKERIRSQILAICSALLADAYSERCSLNGASWTAGFGIILLLFPLIIEIFIFTKSFHIFVL